MNRTNMIIIAVLAVIIIVVAGVLAYELTKPSGTSGEGTHIDLYASDSPYGFGTSAGSITSPGTEFAAYIRTNLYDYYAQRWNCAT